MVDPWLLLVCGWLVYGRSVVGLVQGCFGGDGKGRVIAAMSGTKSVWFKTKFRKPFNA